ncbi:MAG: tRNA (adenosine(37)-N6)-threonylcarbamoyltransferase complex ATPase subunit type 1 TsaE [Nannocystaceae bacterium]
MKTEPLSLSAFCAHARKLGQSLRGGELLLLHGSMGAGKTTFTRALAEGLAVDHPARVRSPTFSLCVTYPGPIPLMHLDLYRLDETGDVATAAFEALGLDFDDLVRPNQVVAVEWASRWRDPPEDHLAVQFHISGAEYEHRIIEVIPHGRYAQQVLARWRQALGSP